MRNTVGNGAREGVRDDGVGDAGMSRWVVVVVAMMLSSGCVGDDDTMYEMEGEEEPIFEADPESIGAADQWTSSTVGELVQARNCSTAPTMPLNSQIAQQMNCIESGFFRDIDDIPNISLGGGANPFLQRPAAEALARVAAAHPSSTLSLSSTWRSVVQQMILKSWQGSCGIGVAASPGRSNHESGLAVDLPSSSRSTFHSSLEANGFVWYCTENNRGQLAGCRDSVHYTYRGGGQDLRTRAVLAFQQLWNRAHPEDPIVEDGRYGSSTAARIQQTPLSGFSTGASCANTLVRESTYPEEEEEEDWDAWAEPCTAYGVPGTCIDVRECDSVTHESVSGHCSGGWSIQCCIPIDVDEPDPDSCTAYGTEGMCIDMNDCPSTTHESIMGYCDGDFNIQCCIPR